MAHVPASFDEIRSLLLDFSPELTVLDVSQANRRFYLLAICEDGGLVRLIREDKDYPPTRCVYGLTAKGVEARTKQNPIQEALGL